MTSITLSTKIQRSVEPVIKKVITPGNFGVLSRVIPIKVSQLIVEKMANLMFKEQVNEGEFGFLQQRLAQIVLIDASIFIGLSFSGGKITCDRFRSETFESDVTLSINTVDAISLLQQEVDPDTLFFQRKLKISGDTELGHHIKNTVDTINLSIIPGFVVKALTEYKRIIQ